MGVEESWHATHDYIFITVFQEEIFNSIEKVQNTKIMCVLDLE